jgi:hypothetical protein
MILKFIARFFRKKTPLRTDDLDKAKEQGLITEEEMLRLKLMRTEGALKNWEEEHNLKRKK